MIRIKRINFIGAEYNQYQPDEPIDVQALDTYFSLTMKDAKKFLKELKTAIKQAEEDK